MAAPGSDVEAPETSTSTVRLAALPPFKPDLFERSWQSVPHPTLPLIATAHQKAVTVFSLSTLSAHSSLTRFHERSVRAVAWKPQLAAHKLCLVTGSFDSTAGLWRWEGEGGAKDELEIEVGRARDDESDRDDDEWELTLVLEGHDSEIKSVAFAPAGHYLATCSRDKSVWIWEDIAATGADEDWETVAVLNEHDGDVKAVAWCPDTNRSGRGRYSSDVLASASYDNTIRIWREDGDGDWVCVAVLEGHEGTVWGIAWEEKPENNRFPRIASWSADTTIRIWTLKEDEDEDETPRHAWGGLGGVPNTMRRSLKEEWECTAILPKAHTRDIYSATWSKDSGLLASTGSDGIIAVYREGQGPPCASNREADAAAEAPQTSTEWEIVTTAKNAHGPYEVNHITWCKRYDASCPAEKRGMEEMLVTTGDDGIVRPWQVILT